MGNIDSKRDSVTNDGIMGCHPNRTRKFSELPESFQQFFDGRFSRKHRKERPHRNVAKTRSTCSDYSSRNGSGADADYSSCGAQNDGNVGAIDNNVTPPIVVTQQQEYLHHGILPHSANSCANFFTQQHSCAANGARSANASFRTVRLTSPTNADNTSLPSAELKQHSTMRAGMRRVKSFRNPVCRSRGSFRHSVCPLTGLTERQKKLITITWREMNVFTAHAMVRAMFETFYQRDAHYLQFIGVECGASNETEAQQQNWRNNPRFRLHEQRFYDTLNEVIRTIHTPALSSDRLLELGADYEVTFSNNGSFKQKYSENRKCDVPLSNALNAINQSESDYDRSGKYDKRRAFNDLAENDSSNHNENGNDGMKNSGNEYGISSSTHIDSAEHKAPASSRNAHSFNESQQKRSDSMKSSNSSSGVSSTDNYANTQRRIPSQYWKSLNAAFMDAVREVHWVKISGGASNKFSASSESPSPSFLIPSNQRFLLSPTSASLGDSPTHSQSAQLQTHGSFLCPHAQSRCNSELSPEAVADDSSSVIMISCEDRTCRNAAQASKERDAAHISNEYNNRNFAPLIVRNRYGSGNSHHRALTGHFMSAPSYGNNGVASPLVISGTPSPSFESFGAQSGRGAANTVVGGGAADNSSYFFHSKNFSSLKYGASTRYRPQGIGRCCGGGGATTAAATTPAIEAWNHFGVYVIAQIRFGYEMERALQKHASRLIAAFNWTIDEADGMKVDARVIEHASQNLESNFRNLLTDEQCHERIERAGVDNNGELQAPETTNANGRLQRQMNGTSEKFMQSKRARLPERTLCKSVG